MALDPLHAPDATQELELLELQLRLDDPPDVTVVGLADRVAEGAGVGVGPGPGFGDGTGEPLPPPSLAENVVEPEPEHPIKTKSGRTKHNNTVMGVGRPTARIPVFFTLNLTM